MKKSGIRAAVLISIMCLLISIAAGSVFAEDMQQMTVTLRIEGISENLFYEELEIEYNAELTAAEALIYADETYDSLTVTGADTGFISDINGEASGTFGGWDGWLFMVNEESPSVGLDGYAMTDGDVLLIYYGDPFGEGMQFPQADLTNLDDGIIRFTSSDTTYDEEYNPTVTVNPVVGAEVTWHTGTASTSFTTDSDGKIDIPEELRTPGTHKIQIAKTGAVSSGSSYLPMVLRFAPDYEVAIEEAASSSEESNPASGDTSTVYLTTAFIALLAAALVLKRTGRKPSDEKTI